MFFFFKNIIALLIACYFFSFYEIFQLNVDLFTMNFPEFSSTFVSFLINAQFDMKIEMSFVIILIRNQRLKVVLSEKLKEKLVKHLKRFESFESSVWTPHNSFHDELEERSCSEENIWRLQLRIVLKFEVQKRKLWGFIQSCWRVSIETCVFLKACQPLF